MNICFYSPYIPKHVGGGEKYLFDCARLLAKNSKNKVSIAVSSKAADISQDLEQKARLKYEKFLGNSLSNISFIPTLLGTSASFITKLLWTQKFDVLYYATDGSLFFSLAKRNVLHIQTPLKLDKSSVINRLKLKNWAIKNTNSNFTKKVIEKSWRTKIDVVHHPMVEPWPGLSTKPKKEKIILNVGRFFRQLHSKRQDVLVDVFAQLLKKNPKLTKNWKLVLIGSVEDKDYLKEVKKAAKDLPVEILTKATRAQLLDYYQKASIYWHATGFGVDEKINPQKVEHFGISTVEAMLAGCVPVVVGKGGQVEVLGADLKSWLWQTKNEAVQKTTTLIKAPKLLKKEAKKSQERALVFSREVFEGKLMEMIRL